jgi:signal transduction histidine kinase
VALAVEERGGTLDVRSAPGDGTVVEVTLPARLPELLPSPLGSPER